MEQTKKLNNGCYYLTIEEGELTLNCCPVYSIETQDGMVILTTERGTFKAAVDPRYFGIDAPEEMDLFDCCESITR